MVFDINKAINKMIGNKKFGGKNDLDFDGVKNKKDCQPKNTMRQDKLYPAHVKQQHENDFDSLTENQQGIYNDEKRHGAVHSVAMRYAQNND